MGKTMPISQTASGVAGPLPQPVVPSGAMGTEAHPVSAGRLLTLDQTRQEYPCDGCGAPCCSYLPLHTFSITNLRELDHALYLLNFPHIELGLSSTGEWGVYYHCPCRFLDREKGLCSIYEDELRPSICAHYSPYGCWYKRVIGSNADESFLWIDRVRMDALVKHLVFDENLDIVSAPDWATMCSTVEEIPLAEEPSDSPAEDPVFEQWLYDAAYGAPTEAPVETGYTYTSLMDPCAGCGAFCCQYLVFPQAAPATRVNLDYLHFVLGFPGIEIGASDGDWFVLVRTRCRHLQDGRCSIYGTPERPHLCTFYDAHGCQYVAQFAEPRPSDFMRIELEQFFWLVEAIGFDRHGNITRMPATEELRRHIERQWHATVLAQSEDAVASDSTNSDMAAALPDSP